MLDLRLLRSAPAILVQFAGLVDSNLARIESTTHSTSIFQQPRREASDASHCSVTAGRVGLPSRRWHDIRDVDDRQRGAVLRLFSATRRNYPGCTGNTPYASRTRPAIA
jgi:hypothetical protein